jgi:hypothetical protein
MQQVARFELVPFEERQILTVQNGDGIYVVMKPVAEFLGLDWSAQYRRIQRHPAISKGIAVMAIPSGGGMQDATALGLEQFHGWLVTISPDRIADPEKRATIIRYQERAFRVIFEHFHGPLNARQPGVSPVAARIAMQNQVLSLTAKLIKATHAEERRLMHTLLDGMCGELGVDTPPLERLGHDAPPPPDLLVPFWKAVDQLRGKGLLLNHSRISGRIAISLPEVQQALNKLGVRLPIGREMKAALRQSTNPRFVTNGAVNSIEGKTVNCWVFATVN